MRAVKGSPGHFPKERDIGNRKALAWAKGRSLGNRLRSNRRVGAGEKCLPVGGRVRKLRAVEDQSASIPEERKSELAVDSVRNYLGCDNFEEFDLED